MAFLSPLQPNSPVQNNKNNATHFKIQTDATKQTVLKRIKDYSV